MPACLRGTAWFPQDGVSWKFEHFFFKSVEKIQVSLNLDKKTGIVHEDKYTFLIISWSSLLILRNVSERSCTENKTHISCPVSPSPKKSAIYEKMWNNIVELGGPQMTVWCIWIECWIPMAKNTHSEHVILIEFSTATMCALTRPSIMFYVQCLPSSLSYSRFILFK